MNRTPPGSLKRSAVEVECDMELEASGTGMPAEGAARLPAGVVSAWVYELTEPLIAVERRFATELRLERAAREYPGWVATVLGGLIGDLVIRLSPRSALSYIGARMGPLSVPDRCWVVPDEDEVCGKLPPGFLPPGADDEFSESTRRIFPKGLPPTAQIVLGLTGSTATPVPEGEAAKQFPVRPLRWENLGEFGPWSDVFDHPGVTDVQQRLSQPWTVATAALLLCWRRGQLDDELGSAGPSELSPEAGARALMVAGIHAVRWGVWSMRSSTPDVTGLPLQEHLQTSARSWSMRADAALRGWSPADDGPDYTRRARSASREDGTSSAEK